MPFTRFSILLTILGFGFVPTYVKGEKGKYKLVVSEKSWEKLKKSSTTSLTYVHTVRKKAW